MQILITGGAGFIGSHIAEAYVAEGFNVIVVDNLSTGKVENIPKEAEFENIDIRSPNIEHLLKRHKVDIVNHHAANVSLKKSMREPISDAKINVTGTLNLLQSCSKANVNRIIFASTSAVYGAQESFPISEAHVTLPISPYGTSKLSCEHYLYTYKRTSRVNYLSLRYSQVFGPRQSPFCESGVIAIFFNNILKQAKETKILIHGDGENTRDFVYIDDVVEANVKAINHGGGIINIGTEVETTISDAFDLVAKVCDVGLDGIDVINLPPAKGDPKRVVLTKRRAYQSLGWLPKTGFEEGLKKFHSFLKDEPYEEEEVEDNEP